MHIKGKINKEKLPQADTLKKLTTITSVSINKQHKFRTFSQTTCNFNNNETKNMMSHKFTNFFKNKLERWYFNNTAKKGSAVVKDFAKEFKRHLHITQHCNQMLNDQK